MSIDPRQKTWELAQIDIDAALLFARDIQGNWYRCQGLAAVAWHTKPKVEFMIQKESIKRQTKVSIEKREWLGAHEFLPHYAKTVT